MSEHVVLCETRSPEGFVPCLQAWGFSVPKVLARTFLRWSPSRAPSSRATYIRSTCSGLVQAQARAGPLQATAVPATQPASIVTSVPLETRTACGPPPNGAERNISLMPTATRQGGQIAAPLAQVLLVSAYSSVQCCSMSVTPVLPALRIMAQSVTSTNCPMAPYWSCLR